MTVSGPARDAGRSSLNRSVFLNQLVLAVVILILLCVEQFTQPVHDAPAWFFGGVTLVFAATGLSVIVPWHQYSKNLILIIPVLDMIAIAVIRSAVPDLQPGLLYVFPVIWLSTHFGKVGAVASAGAACLVLWGSVVLSGEEIDLSVVPRLVTAPMTIIFVATTTYLTGRRTNAHRVLLQQQAILLESALAKTRAQQHILDEVINAVDFGVVGFDASGHTTIMNTAHARMHDGTRAVPFTDIPVFDTDRTTPIAVGRRPHERALRGEEFDNVTVWAGGTSLEPRAHAVSARQLESSTGVHEGTVVVTRDVTQELNAIQARDDLVAAVSHELRTPLTSIMGYLELALDDDDMNSGTRGMLDIASTNADRLLALIADILTASSRAVNTAELTIDDCDLEQVVRETIQSQRPSASDRNITLTMNSDGPMVIEGDALRLRQVTDNLISNAIKYNRENGTVEVGLTEEDDTVWLIVRDTGIGIADGDQRRLFERFYRAPSVRNSPVHGTGLGLRISRDIIRAHGGDVTITSVPGDGTTAVVTLPRRREVHPLGVYSSQGARRPAAHAGGDA